MAGRDEAANLFFGPVKDFLKPPGDVPGRAAAPELGATAFLAAGGRQAEHYALRPEQAENALSNLTSDNAATLLRFGEGARFAAVYNPTTGRFLAYPSGDTLLRDGAVPANRVPRNLGHLEVDNVLSETLDVDPMRNLGFTATMKGDGGFGIGWLSRSVNGRNPSFEGNQVPFMMMDPIISTFSRATGRAARSEA